MRLFDISGFGVVVGGVPFRVVLGSSWGGGPKSTFWGRFWTRFGRFGQKRVKRINSVFAVFAQNAPSRSSEIPVFRKSAFLVILAVLAFRVFGVLAGCVRFGVFLGRSQDRDVRSWVGRFGMSDLGMPRSQISGSRGRSQDLGQILALPDLGYWPFWGARCFGAFWVLAVVPKDVILDQIGHADLSDLRGAHRSGGKISIA